MKIAVADGQLEVTERGRGPAVVLIHGTAPAAWGELPALLSDEHRVIAYDRRSFGAARSVPSHGLSAHAADAAAVVRGVGAPATLVAWSIGGVIALEVAATHPELISGLVLLEPPLHAKRHPRPRMVSALLGATLLGKLGRPEAGARRFLRWALWRNDGGSDFDAMPADWHDRLASGDAVAVVRELAAGTGEHLDIDLLGQIRTPTVVLRGDRSDAVFVHAAARAAQIIPGAKLIEATGSGHAIQLNAPHLVASSVRAALTPPTPAHEHPLAHPS